jgi:hypothetical protein
MGEIVVSLRCRPLLRFLNIWKPRVTIDGMEHVRKWGAHMFQVPDGECSVSFDCMFFMWSCGRNEISTAVSNQEKVYLEYKVERMPFLAPGNLRKASLAEGMLWLAAIGPGRSSDNKGSSRTGVILSLIFMGPLGLIQLWRSDQFSYPVKLTITAAMIFLTLFAVSKL